MKITDSSFVGKRVRYTAHYPERSVFCPAVTWIYEGTVEKVRDVEAEAAHFGLSTSRHYHGEFHVTLVDVTATPDPQTPLRRIEHHTHGVFLGQNDKWEFVS